MRAQKPDKYRSKKKSAAEATRPRRLSPAVRFVMTFLATLAVFGAAYAWLTARYHDSLSGFMALTATISGTIASFFGDITTAGKFLTCRGFSVEIIDECTGLLEMVVYLSAVAAFPTTWRKKLIGASLGLPVIYTFNVLRIIVLLYAGAHSRGLFEFLHLYFWQGTLILIIAAVWFGWLYLVVFREEKSALAVSG